MMKFNRVKEIDFDNRVAVVEPGVTNLAITRAVEHRGFYYAPDPSSQIACSIGGNVAENSGGVHCLKYGLTTNNVLGLEIVLITGEIVRLGGRHLDPGGLRPSRPRRRLRGHAWRRDRSDGAAAARAGKRPRLDDRLRLERGGGGLRRRCDRGRDHSGRHGDDGQAAVAAVEDFVHAGYPLEAEAILIVELDGPAGRGRLSRVGLVEAIARKRGATQCRLSTSDEERLAFWAGRKAAFPAVGRLSPDYFCMDGTIPRKELPRVLAEIQRFVATSMGCASSMSFTPATAICIR